jgi:hypothetical protein
MSSCILHINNKTLFEVEITSLFELLREVLNPIDNSTGTSSVSIPILGTLFKLNSKFIPLMQNMGSKGFPVPLLSSIHLVSSKLTIQVHYKYMCTVHVHVHVHVYY